MSGTTLFGTTEGSGLVETNSVIFKLNTDGGGYAMIKRSAHTDETYGTNTEGSLLREGLVLAGDALYGTTRYGGNGGGSVVFAMGLDGSGYTVLRHFTAEDSSGKNSDGALPLAPLTLANGLLYGTTQYGGSAGDGTVFAVNVTPQLLTANSISASAPITLVSM